MFTYKIEPLTEQEIHNTFGQQLSRPVADELEIALASVPYDPKNPNGIKIGPLGSEAQVKSLKGRVAYVTRKIGWNTGKNAKFTEAGKRSSPYRTRVLKQGGSYFLYVLRVLE